MPETGVLNDCTFLTEHNFWIRILVLTKHIYCVLTQAQANKAVSG